MIQGSETRQGGPRKRGGNASKRGLSDEPIPVLMDRDRTGNTTNFVLGKADKAHICAAFKPVLCRDFILCTDRSKALLPQLGKWTHSPQNQLGGGHTYRLQGLSRAERHRLWHPTQNVVIKSAVP